MPPHKGPYGAGGSEKAGRIIEPRKGYSCGKPTVCTHWKAAVLGAIGQVRGHHRGLRAGHVFTGGTRELGRATCLLDDIPGMGDRGTKGPGVVLGAATRSRARKGYHKRTEARKVSGSERQAKRPERGSVAVVAAHSTAEGGEVRPKRPTGGKATAGQSRPTGRTRGRDFALTP